MARGGVGANSDQEPHVLDRTLHYARTSWRWAHYYLGHPALVPRQYVPPRDSEVQRGTTTMQSRNQTKGTVRLSRVQAILGGAL